jgi:hypothetical protein
VDLLYVAENVLLATREYKNWPAAIKARTTRREFEIVTLRNGLQIRGSKEFKFLMNQIFYKKAYTPPPNSRLAPTTSSWIVEQMVAYLQSSLPL